MDDEASWTIYIGVCIREASSHLTASCGSSRPMQRLHLATWMVSRRDKTSPKLSLACMWSASPSGCFIHHERVPIIGRAGGQACIKPKVMAINDSRRVTTRASRRIFDHCCPTRSDMWSRCLKRAMTWRQSYQVHSSRFCSQQYDGTITCSIEGAFGRIWDQRLEYYITSTDSWRAPFRHSFWRQNRHI